MLYDPKWEKPVVKLTEWQKLLLSAAEIIEERGHAKGALCDGNGRVCLVAALNIADTGQFMWCTANRQPALDAMGQHLGFGAHPNLKLVEWNNKPERTAGDVTAAMRAAAR